MTNRIAVIALGGLVCSLLLACSRREMIEVYTVPKSTDAGPAVAPESPGHTPAGAGQRMLAAVVPVFNKAAPESGRAWFFKVVGPSEPVAAHADLFSEFVRSLKFTADREPTWTLPEGWKQLPGSGMRFATLQIGTADPPLELTVIPLSMPAGDPSAYILSNVNRWRGQLGLGPVSKDELPANTLEIDLGDTQATLVNLVGEER